MWYKILQPVPLSLTHNLLSPAERVRKPSVCLRKECIWEQSNNWRKAIVVRLDCSAVLPVTEATRFKAVELFFLSSLLYKERRRHKYKRSHTKTFLEEITGTG